MIKCTLLLAFNGYFSCKIIVTEMSMNKDPHYHKVANLIGIF